MYYAHVDYRFDINFKICKLQLAIIYHIRFNALLNTYLIQSRCITTYFLWKYKTFALFPRFKNIVGCKIIIYDKDILKIILWKRHFRGYLLAPYIPRERIYFHFITDLSVSVQL